jgi:hypothetical protein
MLIGAEWWGGLGGQFYALGVSLNDQTTLKCNYLIEFCSCIDTICPAKFFLSKLRDFAKKVGWHFPNGKR